MYTRPAKVGKGAEPSSLHRRQAVRASRMCAAIAFFAGLMMLAGGLAASGAKYDAGLAIAMLGTALFAGGAVASILMSHEWIWSIARAVRLRRRDETRKLEEMKDAQWRLSDNAVRYRQFLDAQHDFVVRHSLDGRLRFANRAFFSAFDVRGEDVLGSIYRHPVIRTEAAVGSSPSRRRTLEFVKTRNGKRWIAWIASEVIGETREIEIQSVGHDVTAEREIEQNLKTARDRAEATSQEKSRFLAAMSQEIRTPMNGILGMISLMRDTSLDGEQAVQARAVEESARALLVLLDDILDFSKIDAGKLDLTTDVFSLQNCIAQTLQLMMPDAAAKRLALTSTMSSAVPEWVRGDEMRVRQIILNLLSNTVKLTNAGGVSVRTELDLNKPSFPNAVRIAIEIADSRAVIPPGAPDRLLDEFDRGETTASHPGDTGLGLAISKRLAQAMSGAVVADKDRAKGAGFTAVLELQRAEAPGKAAIEDTCATSGLARRRPFSVLVAEDNRINALLTCKVIERAGGRATVVEDGRSAIKAMWETIEGKRPAYDVVLMDLQMPGIDGITATKSIKALYSERRPLGPPCPPIIALTANAFPEDRERCRSAGMDDYLAKPFDARDLHDLLLRWTGPNLGEATPVA
ncbi:response regulator [Hyphomicrobium sp.]|uniref:response regulator n=1 Tax=Hyphomicrobium sp. TaxID=82 RepID=UPI000FA88591|nr:response regulator [Hyphomicrobium sp.]RUP08922.1 MAG: response regulator [Hyphomicrobium sp.]